MKKNFKITTEIINTINFNNYCFVFNTMRIGINSPSYRYHVRFDPLRTVEANIYGLSKEGFYELKREFANFRDDYPEEKFKLYIEEIK